MPELVLGAPEEFAKARRDFGNNRIYATAYGALHVEPFYGRLLKTLTPPSETRQDTTWTVPKDTHDPRILYSDVIPSQRNAKPEGAHSIVELTYNLDDGEGDVPTRVMILNSTPRPCPGVKKIKVIAGRVSVYGGFTPLNE